MTLAGMYCVVFLGSSIKMFFHFCSFYFAQYFCLEIIINDYCSVTPSSTNELASYACKYIGNGCVYKIEKYILFLQIKECGVVMTEEVLNILTPLLGNACCRVRVGDFKSLSIGFGRKIYHNKPKHIDKYYGEWEIGTYYCAWRMVSGNKILCASSDTMSYIALLHNRATQIPIGSIVSITQISDVDVKVKTDSGVDIDFLATISDDDQYFHVFGPNHLYVELAVGGKWTIAKSNEPFVRS